jgi:phosphocarrier protein
MTYSKTLKVSNELGLHARAAGKIAKLAENAKAEVFIGKDGEEADATSVLDVIGLYCPYGSNITVRIADKADRKVLDQIVRLIERGFGEF